MTDIEKKLASLAERRTEILKLPAKKAMDVILSSADAPAIVHSLAEQDFYFLINEIGPADSMELIALASNKQWEYIFDLVSWQKDGVDVKNVVNWFDLMMTADLDRFVTWMSREKHDFLELLYYYNLEAGMREHDQESSDFPDDFFTFDDIFYVRFVKKPGIHEGFDDDAFARRDGLLYKFLKRFAEIDYERYQDFLFYTANVLPAEAEEEAYRLRNVRLAEKGLLPFDEAVGIYQPGVDIGRLPNRNRDIPLFDGGMPVPLSPTGQLDEKTIFSRALARIDASAILRDLQVELAALCNHIAVADQTPITGQDDLARVVAKAAGYVSIGLTKIAGDETDISPDIRTERAASILGTCFLADIFRVGYSEAAAVKQEAEKWHRASWFYKKELPLHFWDDHRQGILAGLLIKRPLFYDDAPDASANRRAIMNVEEFAGGGVFREFFRVEEIQQARQVLKDLTAQDELLELVDYDLSAVSPNTVTCENLLLTAWARNQLDMPDMIDFISIEDFRAFFVQLFGLAGQERKKENGGGRVIGDEMKQAFLNWLSKKTGRDAFDLSRTAGPIFEKMFDRVEDELGRVAVDDLDPVYINMFLVC